MKCPECNTETEVCANTFGDLYWCNNCGCQWINNYEDIIR